MITRADRLAIVDVLQGAAMIALALWCMHGPLTWWTLIPIAIGFWGAHRFDRGCKNLKADPTP